MRNALMKDTESTTLVRTIAGAARLTRLFLQELFLGDLNCPHSWQFHPSLRENLDYDRSQNIGHDTSLLVILFWTALQPFFDVSICPHFRKNISRCIHVLVGSMTIRTG